MHPIAETAFVIHGGAGVDDALTPGRGLLAHRRHRAHLGAVAEARRVGDPRPLMNERDGAQTVPHHALVDVEALASVIAADRDGKGRLHVTVLGDPAEQRLPLVQARHAREG